ncbi:uncharacterized protein LOC116208893 isoform X2 [Punica granatum]|uniref:Uncharacterized protein LOC116208893 isoform X2 n=1 Tax=Punica granatum TaxID=22663 RepID=A0A6P8E0Q8_PUNGR|nr:uncharacterized protein LOC116208893 isoform X2 [Punica granatum]
MEDKKGDFANNRSVSPGSTMKRPDSHKLYSTRDSNSIPASDLWTDGLICAFEFIRGRKVSSISKSVLRAPSKAPTYLDHSKVQVPTNGASIGSPQNLNRQRSSDTSSLQDSLGHPDAAFDGYRDSQIHQLGQFRGADRLEGSHWIPIGWARISELAQHVQVDAGWTTQQIESMDDDEDVTVADLAAPYWERPAGPVWWCHLQAGHPSVEAWLSNAQWLHPAISLALRDEGRLISERMKHLLYEVPVRVAGGLLFELLGQSAGDPFVNEDDIPVVLRSWQAQNFLVTVLHIKGTVSTLNVLGITEVQELLLAGGYNVPRTVHEVIALLACRLTRWDDRRNHEDMNLFSIILNQEIRRLSKQVIRVKWSLHAREEIVFELLQHLKGNVTRTHLEAIRKSTREMIEEQEAVRGRLFTIQDVMQSTVRAWLQDRSLRVTHNLAVFGGCGLVLSIITGLFGINVDGIPGSTNTPYAFGLFAGILFFTGVVLIAVGLVYLGLKRPITEEQVEVRKMELQELVKMFQHEAETHAQVGKPLYRNNLTPTAGDIVVIT